MSDIIPLNPKITNAGLNAVFNASNTGLEGYISHVAFGDGAGSSYQPTGTETSLRREKARVTIGGGERETPTQILVQGVLDEAPEFWIREVGFFLNDGTLFAVWSDVDAITGDDILMAYKKDGVPFIFAYGLALSGVPANSVNVQIGGPAVNVVFNREFALITTGLAQQALRQFQFSEYHKATHGVYLGDQT